MSKELLLQIDSMEKIIPEYTEKLFVDGFRSIDFNTFNNINSLYIVGSGDSFSSALSLKDVVKKYTGVTDITVLDVITFSRFLSEDKLKNNSEEIALIGISNGGETARVIEAIERGNKFGVTTFLITNNLESRGAKQANYTIPMELPELEYNSPGLISYYGTTLTLLLFSLKLGESKGIVTREEIEEEKDKILNTFNDYLTTLDETKNKARAVAEEIADKDFYDFIADGPRNKATAYFNSAKFVECSGKIVNLHDSEEWCHVNTFLKNPTEIPTFFFTNKNSASYSRMIETAKQATAINRKLTIIGNVEKSDFPEASNFFELPKGSTVEDITVLFDYIPLTLVAGYVAEINNDRYFNDELHLENQTIRNSKIVVK